MVRQPETEGVKTEGRKLGAATKKIKNGGKHGRWEKRDKSMWTGKPIAARATTYSFPKTREKG